MRILLFGKNGQLGWELHRALAPLGDISALDYPEVDLTKPDTARRTVRTARPDLIINASAYTAVDRAESEPELAFAVNARAVGEMAEEARACGAALIHFSTDYVFDGTASTPYGEDAEPNPLSVYGKSKLAGENLALAMGAAVLVLRTAWVYSLRGETFVRKTLQWARQNEVLRIVDDQVSNPTWARMLAQVTALVAARAGSDPAAWIGERCGLYHLAGAGFVSRFEWAQEILKHVPPGAGLKVKQILPAKTADYPAPARRPLYSALDSSRFGQTFGLRLPDWRAALELAMQEGPLGE